MRTIRWILAPGQDVFRISHLCNTRECALCTTHPACVCPCHGVTQVVLDEVDDDV